MIRNNYSSEQLENELKELLVREQKLIDVVVKYGESDVTKAMLEEVRQKQEEVKTTIRENIALPKPLTKEIVLNYLKGNFDDDGKIKARQKLFDRLVNRVYVYDNYVMYTTNLDEIEGSPMRSFLLEGGGTEPLPEWFAQDSQMVTKNHC